MKLSELTKKREIAIVESATNEAMSEKALEMLEAMQIFIAKDEIDPELVESIIAALSTVLVENEDFEDEDEDESEEDEDEDEDESEEDEDDSEEECEDEELEEGTIVPAAIRIKHNREHAKWARTHKTLMKKYALRAKRPHHIDLARSKAAKKAHQVYNY